MLVLIQLQCENGPLSQANITNSLVAQAKPRTENQRRNTLSWIAQEKARVS